MAESYIIPEWLSAELPAEELAKLQQLAGEHRVKTLVPLAKALSTLVREVEDDIKASGKSDRGEDLTKAFAEFRSAAFPGAPKASLPRVIGAGTAAPSRDRDSKREVAIWKNSSAVVEKLGFASLKVAKAGGVDTQAIRAEVIRLLDAGNESPADAIDASAYAAAVPAAS